MPILTDSIRPSSSADEYPTHFAKFGCGGLHSVATREQLGSISMARRIPGMLCAIQDELAVVALSQDCTTWQPAFRYSANTLFLDGTTDPDNPSGPKQYVVDLASHYGMKLYIDATDVAVNISVLNQSSASNVDVIVLARLHDVIVTFDDLQSSPEPGNTNYANGELPISAGHAVKCSFSADGLIAALCSCVLLDLEIGTRTGIPSTASAYWTFDEITGDNKVLDHAFAGNHDVSVPAAYWTSGSGRVENAIRQTSFASNVASLATATLPSLKSFKNSGFTLRLLYSLPAGNGASSIFSVSAGASVAPEDCDACLYSDSEKVYWVMPGVEPIELTSLSTNYWVLYVIVNPDGTGTIYHHTATATWPENPLATFALDWDDLAEHTTWLFGRKAASGTAPVIFDDTGLWPFPFSTYVASQDFQKVVRSQEQEFVPMYGNVDCMATGSADDLSVVLSEGSLTSVCVDGVRVDVGTRVALAYTSEDADIPPKNGIYEVVVGDAVDPESATFSESGSAVFTVEVGHCYKITIPNGIEATHSGTAIFSDSVLTAVTDSVYAYGPPGESVDVEISELNLERSDDANTAHRMSNYDGRRCLLVTGGRTNIGLWGGGIDPGGTLGVDDVTFERCTIP